MYVPVALLLTGFALYVSYYAFRFSLGGTGIAAVTFGVGMMTAFKAMLLIGFALVVAGPLGVSFGGPSTASLKLAAIAVFCDGLTTWIDAGVGKLTGGAFSNPFGFSAISLPIAAGVYWTLLIYLFSMDPEDSWMVVILLSCFDRIVKWALLLILLKMILSWGGVSGSALPVMAGSPPPTASPVTAHVEDLKERKLLMDAQAMFDSGRQDVARESVANWYKAGAKKVWFSVDRDFSGKTTPVGIIVELPKDKASRTKCYEIMMKYYDVIGVTYDKEEIEDDGEPYLMVETR